MAKKASLDLCHQIIDEFPITSTKSGLLSKQLVWLNKWKEYVFVVPESGNLTAYVRPESIHAQFDHFVELTTSRIAWNEGVIEIVLGLLNMLEIEMIEDDSFDFQQIKEKK